MMYVSKNTYIFFFKTMCVLYSHTDYEQNVTDIVSLLQTDFEKHHCIQLLIG